MRFLRLIGLALLLTLGAVSARADMLLTGVGGPSGANPATIFGSSLVGWYQFDNPANTTASSAFTVVKDLSGQGFDMAGGGGAQNPLVAAGQINGLRAGAFAPASVSFMNTGSVSRPGIAGTPFYFFGILEPRANATTGQLRLAMSSGGASFPASIVIDTGAVVQLSGYNSGASNPVVVGPGNGAVYAYTIIFTTAKITVRVNRIAAVSGSGAMGSGGIAQLFLGTGGGFGANNTFDGWQLEAGVVTGSVTQAQDDSTMAYLLGRAGL